jgi:histone chaperone ASF1
VHSSLGRWCALLLSAKLYVYEQLELLSDLEWRLIYVSSPGNEDLDQELDDCLVGPIPVGVNAFEFEGSSPKPSVIPPEDVLGVAALILTGSYKDQEFVRVGYYQNTEYEDDELKESPPKNVMFEKLVRDISAKPRVTRFQIKWCVSLPHSRIAVS